MKKPYTIIEVLGAIIIIAILLTIGFRHLHSISQRAQLTHSQSDINSITVALYMYKKDYGHFPYLGDTVPSADQVYTYSDIRDFLRANNDRGINYLNGTLQSRFISNPNVISYENGNYMVALDFTNDEEINQAVLSPYSSHNSVQNAAASIRVWMKHPSGGEDLASTLITDGNAGDNLATNSSPTSPDTPPSTDPDSENTPTNTPSTTPSITPDDEGPVDFDIDDEGTIVLNESASMSFTVLGAAISYGGQYDMPVTVSIDVDGSTNEPYGSYSMPLNGNINGTNPKPYDAGELEEDTKVTVSASSWYHNSGDGTSNSDWNEFMTKSSDASDNIAILRDGDPVPDTPGFLGQDGIADMVSDYVDGDKISLNENEAIILFELGTNNMSSSAADFQDAVILVSFSK